MLFFEKLPLHATVGYMNSGNYRERFVADYVQTKIRYEKLKDYINQIEAANAVDKPEPPHDCPVYILREQQESMERYLHVLEVRAKIEGVCLTDQVIEMISENKNSVSSVFKE